MSIVYGQHYEELGPFPDTKFLVAMLDKVFFTSRNVVLNFKIIKFTSQSVERPERDRLVLFLRQLVRNKANCRYLLDAGVVKSLVDLVTLSHLHTNR